MSDLIVGIGEILWDVFPGGKVPGGAPANFAYHVSQLGLNGCVVSAVGDDALGQELRQLLQDKKLAELIEIVDFPTGTVQVSLSENGIPQYEIMEQVAWDNIPFTSKLKTIASQTMAVCFGSLAQRDAVSRATVNAFLKALPADSLKIFDVNLRQHYYDYKLLSDSLSICNILKINDEELEVVSRLFELKEETETEQVRELLSNYGLSVVILTRGSEGSFIFTPDSTSFLPTPIVEIVDTVGAGDAFTAGFVASLLKGKSIEESHRKAVEVAAYVCTQQGAMPVLSDPVKNSL